MKRILYFLMVSLLASSPLKAELHPLVEKARLKCRENRLRIETTYAEGHQQLHAAYLAHLLQQEEGATQAGDLDLIMYCREERKTLTEDVDLKPLGEGAPQAIREGRAKFIRQSEGHRAKRDADMLRLLSEYLNYLDRLQIEMTRQSLIEQALAVREHSGELKAELEELLARQPVKLPEVPTVDPVPPAKVQMREWNFGRAALRGFRLSGEGKFSEQRNILRVSSYGSEEGWHGPRAETPLRLTGDFRLSARINYAARDDDIGRIWIGVELSDGSTYGLRVSDENPKKAEARISITQNGFDKDKSHHRKTRIDLSGQELILERRGEGFSLTANNKELRIKRGGSEAEVVKFFLTIQKKGSEDSLSRAEIDSIKIEAGPLDH